MGDHRRAGAQHGAKICRLQIEFLGSGEGQQLTRDLDTPLRRLAAHVDIPARWMVGIETAFQELECSVDRHQEVVEVVGDATGDAPDRLQLLHLNQGLFRLDPFRGLLLDAPQRRLERFRALANALLKLGFFDSQPPHRQRP